MSLSLNRSPAPTEPIASLVARLEARGGGRIGIRGLLASGALSRRGRRSWGPGLAARRCWTWERSDRRDETWFPQGVAHSWQTGYADNLLAVSWYSTTGSGSRVSIVDLVSGRYQHIGLVEVRQAHQAPTQTRPVSDETRPVSDETRPVSDETRPVSAQVRPVSVHAGGIVWHGRWLHVAATHQGFLTFDVDDLLHDPDAEFGFEYLLPLHATHQAADQAAQGKTGLRFSFMSLDRSARRPALLVGEYVRGAQFGRLAHYPLDEAGHLVTDASGAAHPRVIGEGVAQMQGAVAVRGLFYLTVSHGSRAPGEVVIGYPGTWRRRRFRTPPGPEDLVFHPPTNRFWSVTEHPGRRWIFSMPRRALRA